VIDSTTPYDPADYPDACPTPGDCYFPFPEELGCDPEVFPGGPDSRGNCSSCGGRWDDQPPSVRDAQ
jgi:hypothetical protein